MELRSLPGFYKAVSLTFAALLLAGILLFPSDCLAVKNIKIVFEPGWAPAGVDEGNLQDQVVARMRSQLGFGGTNVNIFTNNNTTSFHKEVIFKAARNGWVVGHHFVCKSTNYVYGGTFKTAFANTPALLNSTAAARVYARTGVHEVAHHYGQDDDGTDPTDPMGRPGLGARVNTPATFKPAAQTEMMTYFRTTARNKADANLKDELLTDESIIAVFGSYPEAEGEIIDDANCFNAEVTVSDPTYEFGWINIYGDFVPKIAEGIGSEVVTMFCGYQMDLALRNVLTGQVFPASTSAAPPIYLNPIPAGESSCPIVDHEYYGRVQINFAMGVIVTMDTFTLNPTSGFIARKHTVSSIPSVREWGVVILALLLIGYAVWRLSRKVRLAQAKR
jgi:hypothetical protein